MSILYGFYRQIQEAFGFREMNWKSIVPMMLSLPGLGWCISISCCRHLYRSWKCRPWRWIWHDPENLLDDAGLLDPTWGVSSGSRVDALIEDLPVGLLQQVEIHKALYRKADILILDEPTGVLFHQEADELFGFLRNFPNRARPSFWSPHKLREIMAITNHVSVMRNGKVLHLKTSDTTVKNWQNWWSDEKFYWGG